MSTPTARIPQPVVTAAQRLHDHGTKIAFSTAALHAIASQLTGFSHEFDHWILFCTNHWLDDDRKQEFSVGSFGIGGREPAAMLLAGLRALRQDIEAAPTARQLRKTYRLVMEVRHPLDGGAVAWIDAETGEVEKTKPWLQVEAEAAKVLSDHQLNGTACVVCGGDGGREGMVPMGLETTTSTEVFACSCCSRPSKLMVQRWISNSAAAVPAVKESGVIEGVSADSAQGTERASLDTTGLSALDAKILTCRVGEYPWDEWKVKALAAGVPEDLATAGRAVMREAYNHDWPKRLQKECGWGDEGAAMIMLALKEPEKAAKRWEWLEATDGGRHFGNVESEVVA